MDMNARAPRRCEKWPRTRVRRRGVSSSGLCPHLSWRLSLLYSYFPASGAPLFSCPALPPSQRIVWTTAWPCAGGEAVLGQGDRTDLSRGSEEQENVRTGPHSRSLAPGSVSDDRPGCRSSPSAWW